MNDFLPGPDLGPIRPHKTRLAAEYELLGTLIRCSRAYPVKPTVRVDPATLSQPIMRDALDALRAAWPWDHWLDGNNAVWEGLGGKYPHNEISRLLVEAAIWGQPPGGYDALANDYNRMHAQSPARQ